MRHLRIFAGPDAIQRIREEGVNATQFRVMLGASGGPKWFVLYGLDRYLFGEFFRGRSEPLDTLGTSAGAWRMSCLATAEPEAAITRLAELYSHENYSPHPDVTEITEKARVMLHAVIGESGKREIVDNAVFRTHLIASRCKGIGSSPSKQLQALALGGAAVSNVFSRRALSWFLQRILFSVSGSASPWSNLQDLDTRLVQLDEQNIFSAMLASGSIPFALAGERDISGAPAGLYWDGGITDYHFDLPFHQGDGLVLYPHFSPKVVPGWFDKHLPWRKPHPANFRNVLLLCPSEEFVASLRYGKIPDRTDFKTMDFHTRLTYWQQVLDLSRHIADDFAELVASGTGRDEVQPLLLR